MSESITVRVPGSTSNCGAGFDTLGLALAIYNRVTISSGAGIEPVPERPQDGRAQDIVGLAAGSFFMASGKSRSGFRYRIEGDVPAARGLGSSVTVVAGVLAGLNALHSGGLDRHRLIGLASKVEGHPDNASAGILGGFCVSRSDPATGDYLGTVRFEIPAHFAFVVVSPDLLQLTKESRGALPRTLPYFDAVRSINSAAYLVAAIASGEFSRLGHAVGDFMHEPYRLPKIPGGRASIDAGIAAGALTGWLSGSGSSVLCLCEHSVSERVMGAMKAAFAASGMNAQGRVLLADNRGIEVG